MVNAFVDLATSTRDTGLALTQHEWDEFGNPLQDKKAAELIDALCPIRNLRFVGNQYPLTLLVATMDDPNVPSWHAFRYARKMREMNLASTLDCRLLILPHGGHHLHGGSRLYAYSIEVAFILKSLATMDPTTTVYVRQL
jgi:oligopeptidase B